MKYLHLVWAALFRRKTRTIFTLLSVLAAFLLFGLLDSVRSAFRQRGRERRRRRSAGHGLEDQLHAAAAEEPAGQRIEAMPGVSDVTYANWFGGIYQDPKNFFPNEAVAPNYLDAVSRAGACQPAQRKAFHDTRTGAVVGESLAPQVPLEGRRQDSAAGDDLSRRRTASNTWTFDLVGIFHGRDPKQQGPGEGAALQLGLLRRGPRVRQWQRRLVRHARRRSAIRPIAWRRRSMRSRPIRITRRRRRPSRPSRPAFVSQFGDIGLIVGAIMAAVFFTLILLTGNTMAQAVRERIPELAVLKTIGFSNSSVLGARARRIGAAAAVRRRDRARARSSGRERSAHGVRNRCCRCCRSVAPIWTRGLMLAVLIGLVVGALPALRGMRLRIVDALAGR